jgi:hypothetical protein
MDKPTIKVLLIDDDEGIFQSIRNKAANDNIHLIYAQSLVEGLSILDDDTQVRGIILDGKGFIDQGQIKGSETSNFVFQALQTLRLYEEKKRKYFSKVVFTAWYDQLLEPLGENIKVFDKKKAAIDQNVLTNMFLELRQEIESSEDLELIQYHKDLFNLFDNHYLKAKDSELLLQILKRQKNNIASFNDIRKLLEKIYNRLNQTDIKLIPDNLFHKKDSPNLTYIAKYFAGLEVKQNNNVLYRFTGKKLIPDHIIYCMDFISKTCGALSHSYQFKTSQNINSSLIEALFEILLWLKETIDQKKQFKNQF